jgi:hypothetical protein
MSLKVTEAAKDWANLAGEEGPVVRLRDGLGQSQ